jgi:hypothetical protein
MTALLIVAVLAVAGLAAFKILENKKKVSNNEPIIVEPVKFEQPKVEVVIAPKVEPVIEPKKEVVVPVKKELTLKPKKQSAEKKTEPKQKKPTTKKSDKKQK